jgi:nucleotide-binding universal stress UspA family protein
MDRIVVATDRSETAERAVEWAADLARRFGSELVLVQVLAPDGQAPGSATARSSAAGRSHSTAPTPEGAW